MSEYDTFLLRIWKEDQNKVPRRFSLENTRTGIRMGFTDLERMLEFLETQMAEADKQLLAH